MQSRQHQLVLVALLMLLAGAPVAGEPDGIAAVAVRAQAGDAAAACILLRGGQAELLLALPCPPLAAWQQDRAPRSGLAPADLAILLEAHAAMQVGDGPRGLQAMQARRRRAEAVLATLPADAPPLVHALAAELRRRHDLAPAAAVVVPAAVDGAPADQRLAGELARAWAAADRVAAGTIAVAAEDLLGDLDDHLAQAAPLLAIARCRRLALPADRRGDREAVQPVVELLERSIDLAEEAGLPQLVVAAVAELDALLDPVVDQDAVAWTRRRGLESRREALDQLGRRADAAIAGCELLDLLRKRGVELGQPLAERRRRIAEERELVAWIRERCADRPGIAMRLELLAVDAAEHADDLPAWIASASAIRRLAGDPACAAYAEAAAEAIDRAVTIMCDHVLIDGRLPPPEGRPALAAFLADELARRGGGLRRDCYRDRVLDQLEPRDPPRLLARIEAAAAADPSPEDRLLLAHHLLRQQQADPRPAAWLRQALAADPSLSLYGGSDGDVRWRVAEEMADWADHLPAGHPAAASLHALAAEAWAAAARAHHLAWPRWQAARRWRLAGAVIPAGWLPPIDPASRACGGHDPIALSAACSRIAAAPADAAAWTGLLDLLGVAECDQIDDHERPYTYSGGLSRIAMAREMWHLGDVAAGQLARAARAEPARIALAVQLIGELAGTHAAALLPGLCAAAPADCEWGRMLPALARADRGLLAQQLQRLADLPRADIFGRLLPRAACSLDEAAVAGLMHAAVRRADVGTLVRDAVAWLLRRPGRLAMAEILDLWGRFPHYPELRSDLLTAVAASGDPGAHLFLIAVLASREGEVLRGQAARLLGLLGRREAVSALRSAVGADDQFMSAPAALALTALGEDLAGSELLRRWSGMGIDDDRAIAAHAILAVLRHDQASADWLRGESASGDAAWPRWACLRALCATRRSDAVPLVIERLRAMPELSGLRQSAWMAEEDRRHLARLLGWLPWVDGQRAVVTDLLGRAPDPPLPEPLAGSGSGLDGLTWGP